jgi:hypothetical protein
LFIKGSDRDPDSTGNNELISHAKGFEWNEPDVYTQVAEAMGVNLIISLPRFQYLGFILKISHFSTGIHPFKYSVSNGNTLVIKVALFDQGDVNLMILVKIFFRKTVFI